MVTERGPGIIMPEQSTPLQFWDDTFNKGLEGTWEMGRQDHKSIGRTGDKPFFQDVGNL
jgi:hypothetical protein